MANPTLGREPVSDPPADPAPEQPDRGPLTTEHLEELLLLYPPCLWGTHRSRMASLEKHVDSWEEYDHFASLFVAYDLYMGKTKGEREKYTKHLPNFMVDTHLHRDLKKLGYVGKVSLAKEDIVPQQFQKRWVPPHRPLYPWELEPENPFTNEEKERIIQQMKIDEGYDDRTNEKWWYWA